MLTARVKTGVIAVGEWSNEISAKTAKRITFNRLISEESQLTEVDKSDDSCKTYQVKKGDSLFSIAKNILGDGNLFDQIIIENIAKYPDLEKSDKIMPGWELRIGCQDAITESNSSLNKSYSLKIKVTGKDNKPVSDAVVTIHSDPQTTRTDKDGVAVFNNLEPGEHNLEVKYQDYVGNQTLYLGGDKTDYSLEITVTPKNILLDPVVIMLISTLVVLSIVLVIVLKKKLSYRR